MSTEDNYWTDIESMAKEIVEECSTIEEIQDRIHEDVDSSSWIIYYRNHETILNETKNEPDNSDVLAMADPKKSGWRDLRQTAAFLAMEADLSQVCMKLFNEKEDDLENDEDDDELDEDELDEDDEDTLED